MRRALASGALVGLSLTAVVALAQEPPPPPPPAPAPPAPSAVPPTAAPAESAAPAAPPPAESAAVTAVPPMSEVAIGAPSKMGTSSPKPVDRPPAPKSETKPRDDAWQDGHALGAEGNVYMSGRVGSSSIDAKEEEHFGVGFDLSAWLALSKEYVLGFGLTRAGLGNVVAGSGADGFDADYAVTAAYLGARAFPWRNDFAEIFIGLRVGLAWQDVSVLGIRTLEPNVSPPTSYSCSGVSGPGLALGAGVGGALRLGSRAWLVGHFDGNAYKLTSDVIENCVVGIGTVTSVTLGAGVLYAFDLGSGAKLGAKSSPTQTW